MAADSQRAGSPGPEYARPLRRAEVRRTLAGARAWLLANPDVVGFTTGLRRRRGRERLEECITVFVKRKRAPSRVPARRRIPSFYCVRTRDGGVDRTRRIYTDVIQLGRARSLAARPSVRGGDGIYVQARAGSVGVVTTRAGRKLVLGNRHVLAPRLHAAGDPAVRLRAGASQMVVARLSSWVALPEEGGAGFVDAALARVAAGHGAKFAARRLRDSGGRSVRASRVRRLRDREPGSFRLSGFRSRFRTGRLWDRLAGGGTWPVEFEHLGTRVVDGLYGLRARTRRGDSGAPIYEMVGGAAVLVGLAVAFAEDERSGETITLFHAMVDVERALGEALGDASFRLIE